MTNSSSQSKARRHLPADCLHGRGVGRSVVTPTGTEDPMAGLEIRSVDSPDEVRSFVALGQSDVVNVAGTPVLHSTYEPGWRWSELPKEILKGLSPLSMNWLT